MLSDKQIIEKCADKKLKDDDFLTNFTENWIEENPLLVRDIILSYIMDEIDSSEGEIYEEYIKSVYDECQSKAEYLYE